MEPKVDVQHDYSGNFRVGVDGNWSEWATYESMAVVNPGEPIGEYDPDKSTLVRIFGADREKAAYEAWVRACDARLSEPWRDSEGFAYVGLSPYWAGTFGDQKDVLVLRVREVPTGASLEVRRGGRFAEREAECDTNLGRKPAPLAVP